MPNLFSKFLVSHFLAEYFKSVQTWVAGTTIEQYSDLFGTMVQSVWDNYIQFCIGLPLFLLGVRVEVVS